MTSEVKDTRSKLLIIGVDAGSPALFRRWSATGDLHNIRHLMESGQVREVGFELYQQMLEEEIDRLRSAPVRRTPCLRARRLFDTLVRS